jgi:hypothetical protein
MALRNMSKFFSQQEVEMERMGVMITVSGSGKAQIHDNDATETGQLPWLNLTDGQLKFFGAGPSKQIFARGAGMKIQVQQVRVQ